jgi:hypothetical protein
MLRKTSYVLAAVLLCGVGQAGSSVADESHFIGHLPQGTVELVGVTFYPPTNKSQWWRPDGPAASTGPFRPLGRLDRFKPHVDHKRLVFLVRFENMPADASTAPAGGISSFTTPEWPPSAVGTRSWLSGSGPKKRTGDNSSRDPVPGSQMWEATDGYDVVDAHGLRATNIPMSRPAHPDPHVDAHAAPATNIARSSKPTAPDRAETSSRYGKTTPYYYKMYIATLRPSALTTDLKVGTSMGAWETVISQKPAGGKSSFSREDREWAVTIQKAKMPAGASTSAARFTVRSLSTYGLWNKRLVAVARDGSEHPSWIGDAWGGDNGEAVFDLPFSSIKELRLQIRPCHWVEFHNISLQSGQKTEVQVVSPDAPVSSDK